VAMRLKKCPACGLQKMIGRSKARCKACRIKLSRRVSVSGDMPSALAVLPKAHAGYGSRAINLKELGFEDYAQYLASPLWASIRCKAMLSYGYKCRLCSGPATEVHHLSYDLDTLRSLKRKNLVALCRACHTSVEFTTDGTKRAFSESLRQFFLLERRVEVDTCKPAAVDGATFCERCKVTPLDGRKGMCKACARALKRAKLAYNRNPSPLCIACGRSARKGSSMCRPCEASRGQA
jgi:hypothetical protein